MTEPAFAGDSDTAPTFLIAGGQRCGTTWLYQALARHPDIYLAAPPNPEPKFFVRDTCRQERDEYLRRWFAGAGGATARGEKSVRYLEHPRAATHIAALFPRMRLLFVLRHPAERAVSNYEYSRMHNREDLDFAAAIAAEPGRLDRQPLAAPASTPHAYLARGRYAELLAPFFDAFPKEQLHVVLYEALFSNPREELARAVDFLGADPLPAAELPERVNESPWDHARLSPAGLETLLAHFAASNRDLQQLTGLDVAHWDQPTERLLEITSG